MSTLQARPAHGPLVYCSTEVWQTIPSRLDATGPRHYPNSEGGHPGLLLRQDHNSAREQQRNRNMHWLQSSAETGFVQTLEPLKCTVEQPKQAS